MNGTTQNVLSLAGRIMIAAIFLLSAVGNKIPSFSSVASYMAAEGVPAPQFMLAGAIVFLIAGSLSVIFGYKVQFGAGMLLVFLMAATFFFHDFWTFEGQECQAQTIQFTKNLSLMGAMIFLIANGSGRWSLDERAAAHHSPSDKPASATASAGDVSV